MNFIDKMLGVMIIFAVFSLSGCGREGRFSTAPTDEEIYNFFEENRLVLETFVQFCREQERVKWVGINIDTVDLGPQGDIVDYKSVEIIRESLERLKIESLSCNRDWSIPSTPLLSVWIPLFGIGLSVSGSSKGLEYIPSPGIKLQARLKSGEYKSLGYEGWYIR